MPITLLARNWGYLKQHHNLPDDIVPVDITETAKWFFEEDDTDYRDFREDFPCVVSPWPIAWFEFPAPQWSNANGQLIRVPTLPGLRYGFLVRAVELPEEDRVEALRQDVLLAREESRGGVEVAPDLRARRQEMIEFYLGEGILPRWLQSTAFYVGDEKRLELVATPQFYLDGDGRILSRLAVLTGDTPDSELDVGMVQPVLFALSLLHCKNVTVEDEPPTPAKVAKKRLERGIRDVQFKTLVVKPLRRQLQAEGGGQGPRQALHFVRAHFKEYTEDAPLFGKHVGRYFWPMHAAGSAAQGEVVKDYKVKPR